MRLDLRIVLLNAENLFLLLDDQLPPHFETLSESEWQKFSSSVFSNKPLSKLLKLKKHLLEIDADLVLLTEVGGEESLKNFNQFFLNGDYRLALIEGNSDRSIDVGFLIHKRVPSHFNIISNKDLPINFWYAHERNIEGQPSQKFSRDVAELHLFDRDMSQPFLIALLTHLKSPLDPEGIDPMGIARRTAEFKALIEIYNKVQKQFPKTPIIVCGDMNGNASRHDTEKEFLGFYEATDLDDILELAKKPAEERNTFYPLKSGTLLPGRQIDFAFLSTRAQRLLELSTACVYRYEIANRGRPLGPQTYEEKINLPSDHYPLVFELKGIPLKPE
ncbi:MAG: hypothetical protein RJB66_1978 [Pseudomonadota bacterium]|jgi:hypothetical protein